MKFSFQFTVSLNIPISEDEMRNKYTMDAFREFCDDLCRYIDTRPFVEAVKMQEEAR